MPKDSAARPVRGAHRQQLPEEVATYVREMIISGQVRPGEFLRMEPIADAVGVSSTPVREGLLLLSSEGFVKLVPRRGFMVASFTPEDVRDIFWAQAQLAGELAARAAKRITPERLEKLEKNVAEYEEATARQDSRRVTEIGHAFHREVNLAADSYRLALLLGSVVKQLPNSFYATIEGMVATTSVHPQILDAIRKRQVRKARSLMEQHILERGDHLVQMIEERDFGALATGT